MERCSVQCLYICPDAMTTVPTRPVTAPRVRGQAEVIGKAHRQARIIPHQVGCVEAYGTGTVTRGSIFAPVGPMCGPLIFIRPFCRSIWATVRMLPLPKAVEGQNGMPANWARQSVYACASVTCHNSMPATSGGD